ncbi:MAG: enoyl-[acyl-carrier-protein] reductase FabK [Clostridiales Family XIII bacterium]|jgi:enoyl-[acyl-carrier protein] reductase II|nr:enoyl-[acyl-carrier-protein] reductase FabK [Clostridiales Family XIII bacterium]
MSDLIAESYEDIGILLGIKYPIIQGGMAWIADSSLASAVSNGGGLGVIAAGNAPADFVRAEIAATRALTDKPFGVNVMLLSPYVDEVIAMLCEEKVDVVITGAGNPGKYMAALKASGIKVIPVVASVALAVRMERNGADAVVAEGQEAGGHIGELTGMALIPQVADAVEIPVIGAGGIADGRGVAAAFMLGARGVQVGTRFLVAEECTVSKPYKAMIIKAKDTDTVTTGRSVGRPVRVLKNRMTKEILSLEKSGIDADTFEERLAGTLKAAAKDGDVVNGSVMAGQIAGLVKKEQKAADIIREMFEETKRIYESRNFICGSGSTVPGDGEGSI